MEKLIRMLAGIAALGLCAAAFPARAALVKACSVENPPTDCEKMWAVIAHVDLPKLSGGAVHPTPRCGPKFDGIDWGMTVARAFGAEGDPDKLENLAMDVSGAFQRKLVPQITRHIRGDAAMFIEEGFSKVTPKAWSPSVNTHDQALCAPVMAIVPIDASVREFRFRTYDEKRGEMGCTASTECSIGYCRFVHGYGPPARTSANGVTVYTAIFQSWSPDAARSARLIIFFEMPGGRLPLPYL